MRYLLDANLLVAWGWEDHTDHERVAKWIAGAKILRSTLLLTSAIPQLGFIRVSVQRTKGNLTLSEAGEVLKSMLDSLGPKHRFVPDEVSSTKWPTWCHLASQSTDAHLALLSEAHQAQLATLDTRIPGAFLVP